MDYLSMLQPTPEQQQRLMAERLRQRQEQAAAMQGANEQANQFNTLAAVAQMANNPGAAQVVQLAMRNAQAQHKPINLGAQGFALPASGKFIQSPMYDDEKDAQREQQRVLLATQLQQRDADRAERLGYQRQRDSEANALRMSLAELRAQGRASETDRAAEKADRAAEKAAANLDKDVQRYSTTIDKAGLPEVMNAAQAVRSVLSSNKSGSLSGFGRVQGLIPDALASNEMQANRALMQDAANIILKSRSGTAVTTPEQVRFLRAVGSGVGMDEATLRTGWSNVLSTIGARAASLGAGWAPAVHDEFVRRGGQDYRNFKFDPIPGAVLPQARKATATPMVPGRNHQPAAPGMVPGRAPASAPQGLPTAEQLGLPPGFQVVGVQ